ncbi:ATP-binding cassette domain-containing protein [Pseudooceanicola sp.]|uniref:quaternary amine ABC transporter ATP-binding protein n=1 Tax=Pseudooceanicola sp. TaxID=1914328 RepID=UPI00262A43BB|nr:ATP-binding cassette domain-containing protein [Pseudooceanicola sp.]MDF1856101.1 ATP-binding cassette domain-containing protein [Pseudooceanicola sp.]
MSAVIFDKVSVVFGPRPEAALPLIDQGLSREEVQAETGQVLGVHDCSLTLKRGEILVLMGLSGSGKSTLLRAVNGLTPISRGRVTVRDGDWSCQLPDAGPEALLHLRRDCVAMVFQHFGLLPWRNVRDNVGLGLELAGLDRAERDRRAEEKLALVGLGDWADRKISELSGGMQQRVGLARAFVTDAPVLLMDEPFSALDPLIRSRLQDELLEVQTQLRRSILFVSHDLDEAFKLGDRIAILDGGRIVQCGTPAEIIARPATTHVADFVAHMNPLAVLTARDAMSATPPKTPAAITLAAAIAADAPLTDAITALAAAPGPLAVQAGGAIIGQITAQDIVTALAR